jgi:hypothetical protein
VDKRWLAGFFDGEGHISRSQVVVSQSNLAILNEIKDEYGGKIYKISNSSAYNLCFRQVESLKFLREMLPHLKIKSELAKEKINYLEKLEELGIIGKNRGFLGRHHSEETKIKMGIAISKSLKNRSK